MFLTGMAANPLVAEAASATLGVNFTWGAWALGAVVPGVLGLALLPLLLFKLAPPSLLDGSAAQAQASDTLREMGAWGRGEKTMAVVFLLLIGLWCTAALHGLGSGLVAWIGVMILVITGTERWEHITGNAKAWDTLIWLGGLLAMANALKDEGVVRWFAETMQGQVAGLSGIILVVVIAVIYFYSMMAFSMLTAHISALVAAVHGAFARWRCAQDGYCRFVSLLL